MKRHIPGLAEAAVKLNVEQVIYTDDIFHDIRYQKKRTTIRLRGIVGLLIL